MVVESDEKKTQSQTWHSIHVYLNMDFAHTIIITRLQMIRCIGISLTLSGGLVYSWLTSGVCNGVVCTEMGQSTHAVLKTKCYLGLPDGCVGGNGCG